MDPRMWIASALSAVLLCGMGYRCDAASAPKKHVLVVTYTAGFRHTEAIETGDVVIPEIGAKSGAFDVAFCRTADDVKSMLTPQGLKKFDAVVFNCTTGDLGITDLTAFLDWIKAGHGFVGIHSATDTYHNQPAYLDMIGDEFRTHHQQCEVGALVADPKHPATKSVVAPWKVFDEIYIQKHNDVSKLHVLLYTDKHPNDGSAEANTPGTYLLSWCKPYGKGRVFYTAFGHRKDVWEKEEYRQHLLGGIRWALGLAKGNAKIGNLAPVK